MSKETIAKVATVLSLVGAVSYAVTHYISGAPIDWSTILGAVTAIAAAFGFQSFANLTPKQQ